MSLREHDTREHERVGRRDVTSWRTAAGQALARWARDSRHWTVATWAAVIGIAVMAFAALVSAKTYDAVEEGDGISGLDHPLLRTVIGWRTATLNLWITRFTDLGGPLLMPIIAATLAGLAAIAWRTWTPIVLVALGSIGSLSLTVLGKDLIGRARPPHAEAVPPYEQSFSFPSGHALNSTVVMLLLAYVVALHTRRLWLRVTALVAALAWSVAMGLSRVFLGHHWLSDVIMGWALGALWAGLVITGHRLWLTSRRAHSA